MGFHPIIFFVASQLSTLYQFSVHTETINKLHPWIEKYFGTPSNHRVHHGSQEKYLDKNFGATLMIWDHLFGSFQYEEEQPVYGLTTPLTDKINPFKLNFHEYSDILQDVKKSKSLREGLFYIFASPCKVRQRKQLTKGSFLKVKFKNTAKSGTWDEIIKIQESFLILLFSTQECIPAQTTIKKGLPEPVTKNLLFFLQRDPGCQYSNLRT